MISHPARTKPAGKRFLWGQKCTHAFEPHTCCASNEVLCTLCPKRSLFAIHQGQAFSVPKNTLVSQESQRDAEKGE